MKDLYKILGVDPDCAQQIIKSAYKSKARQLHPDKSGGSTEAFQELNEAYSALRDPERRKQYDSGGGTVQKPDIYTVANSRLATMFKQAAEKAQDHIDIVETIRTSLASNAMNMQSEIGVQNKNIKNYTHLKERIHYSGKRNDMFSGVLDQNITNCNMIIEQLSYEINLNKVVIELLNDYECDTVERKPSSYSVGVATSTGFYNVFAR